MNNLHPVMAAAMAAFMPMMATIEEDEDLDVELEDAEDEEPHEVICNACSGSGEGQNEGSTCRVCRGLGEVWVTE